MEYFLVKQDKRIENGVTIPWEDFTPEPKCTAMSFSDDKRFLDYIEGEYLFVSEALKKVLERYNIKLTWYVYGVTDPVKKEQKVYFFTDQVPVADCISDKTEYNLRGQVKHLVLDCKGIRGGRYFYVRNGKERFLIFRQDVAESILRRNLYGIVLERVDVIAC